jgi:hypothetical protein
VNVLAIMGRAKSGKDTVGDLIKQALPGEIVTIAFADRLKQLAMDLYGLTREDVYTDAGKDRVTDFTCWKCPACQSLDCFQDEARRIVCRKCTAVGLDSALFMGRWTVRMILQHLGTEGCRRIDPYVWVNFAMRNARTALEQGVTITHSDQRPADIGLCFKPRLVVITDCRFRSEMEGVQAAGGSVWRLRRPDTDRQAQGIAAHASENEMDTIPDSKFQRVIRNDSTLEVLQERVSEGLTALLRPR